MAATKKVRARVQRLRLGSNSSEHTNGWLILRPPRARREPYYSESRRSSEKAIDHIVPVNMQIVDGLSGLAAESFDQFPVAIEPVKRFGNCFWVRIANQSVVLVGNEFENAAGVGRGNYRLLAMGSLKRGIAVGILIEGEVRHGKRPPNDVVLFLFGDPPIRNGNSIGNAKP